MTLDHLIVTVLGARRARARETRPARPPSGNPGRRPATPPADQRSAESRTR